VLGAHARSWARFEDHRLVLFAYRPTPNGEESLLADRYTDPRLSSVVHATMPVVIASRDEMSITQSKTLAIAPFGDGEISLTREGGGNARVTCHYFSGAKTESTTNIAGGRLSLPVNCHDATGSPLEWLEVQIA
jgi:hypothetical protein